MYFAIKHLHLTLVAASVSFFIIRFFWMTRDSALLNKKWVKIAPHVLDTFLLASAIALCVILSQYPFATPWLTDKIIGLAAYIVLAMVALKLGRTMTIRWIAFAGALSWIAFLGRVAITKQPILFG